MKAAGTLAEKLSNVQTAQHGSQHPAIGAGEAVAIIQDAISRLPVSGVYQIASASGAATVLGAPGAPEGANVDEEVPEFADFTALESVTIYNLTDGTTFKHVAGMSAGTAQQSLAAANSLLGADGITFGQASDGSPLLTIGTAAALNTAADNLVICFQGR